MLKKTKPTTTNTVNSTTLPIKPSPIFTVIVVLYALIPIITPQLEAWNSNGPKVLFLSLLNLISWIVLRATQSKQPDKNQGSDFFMHPLGVLNILIVVFSLLSFFKAVNIYESLISSAKLFTNFMSAYLLFLIFKRNVAYFFQLILVFTFILVIDSLTVLVNILGYINGDFENIEDIKSVYANKNILSAAIFVKIPFALWLIHYREGFKKILGYIALFLAILATLFMSTRSFYLGLILVSIAFCGFQYWNYRKFQTKKHLWALYSYLVFIVVALGMFSLTQSFLYPSVVTHKNSTRYDANIADRFGTMNTHDESAAKRIMLWGNTIKLIQRDPLLGVGLGNWQIRQLEIEQPTKSDHLFAAKNHNDFLEITSEIGILGGLAFLGVFIFPFLYLYTRRKVLVLGKEDIYLFIPLAGLMAYSVDAFFNFPANRPEIHLFLAVFIASFVSFTSDSRIKPRCPNPKFSLAEIPLVAFMIASVYLLFVNYNSLIYQQISESDRHFNEYSHTADEILNGFPEWPTITQIGEPIACLKCYYLWNEKRNKEAIDLLKKDKSNPYTAEIPLFISQSYFYEGELDSSLKYIEQSRKMMPLDYYLTSWACKVWDEKKEYSKSHAIIEDYLRKEKMNATAWNYLSSTYIRLGQSEKSIPALDSGLIYCKEDTMLIRIKNNRIKEYHNYKYKDLLDKADACLNAKEFEKALALASEIVSKDTLAYRAYELRGLSLMNLKQYEKAIADFNLLIKKSPDKGLYYNDRGICLINMKKKDAACADFKKGMDLADPNATANYQHGCAGK